jgi:WD40 repeat protein
LAYVENDTLYLRPIAENVVATGIFTTAGLWPLFVNWSPNGNWIATVSSEVGETVDGSYPPLTDTVWLVSPKGAPPQQLGTFPGYPIEHIRRELQWSPDSSALLVGMVSPNYIVTLDDHQYPLEEGTKGLAWVPDQSNLLVRKGGGLSIFDQQGQEILQVGDHFVTAWAFSNDGRYLAYSNERVADQPVDIFAFDLQSEEVRWSGSVPAQTVTSLHWTPTSDALIVGGGDYGTPIWAIGIEPEGEVEVLIEKGLLITVIPRLFPTTTWIPKQKPQSELERGERAWQAGDRVSN